MAGFDSGGLNRLKADIGFAHSTVDQSSVGFDGDWCRMGLGQGTDSSALPRCCANELLDPIRRYQARVIETTAQRQALVNELTST